MTVRRSSDILTLPQDRRMADPERLARRRLFDMGARLAPCKPGTKERLWRGSHMASQLLGGDALITVPAGHVVFDVDSPDAQELLAMLDLPPTLTLGSRRGARLLFRLPPGITLTQQIKLLTDLDLLTACFVAPGSVVDGHYYNVVADLPIAELPRSIAEGIRSLQNGPVPLKPLIFTCSDAMASTRATAADNRRRRALAARGRSDRLARRDGTSGADAAQRREGWLNEDVDGRRHQALRSLACQMLRLGETYEAYDRLVRAHPVASKLVGQSHGWLRALWDSTASWLLGQPAGQPGRGQLGGPRWVRRWRQNVAVPAAARWLRHVAAVLERAPLDSAMRQSLRELCVLHAQYAVDFGIYGALNGVDRGRSCYFLAHSLMRQQLGGLGGDAVARRLKRLMAFGVLAPLDRSGLIKDQATYYQLKINGKEVFPALPGTASLSWPVTCADALADHCHRRPCGCTCELDSATAGRRDLVMGGGSPVRPPPLGRTARARPLPPDSAVHVADTAPARADGLPSGPNPSGSAPAGCCRRPSLKPRLPRASR